MNNTMIEYRKKYYSDNKNKIKDRMYEKIECPNCDKYVSRCNLPKHMRTSKCIKNVFTKDKPSKLLMEIYKLKKLSSLENKKETEIKLKEIYEQL